VDNYLSVFDSSSINNSTHPSPPPKGLRFLRAEYYSRKREHSFSESPRARKNKNEERQGEGAETRVLGAFQRRKRDGAESGSRNFGAVKISVTRRGPARRWAEWLESPQSPSVRFNQKPPRRPPPCLQGPRNAGGFLNLSFFVSEFRASKTSMPLHPQIHIQRFSIQRGRRHSGTRSCTPPSQVHPRQDGLTDNRSLHNKR